MSDFADNANPGMRFVPCVKCWMLYHDTHEECPLCVARTQLAERDAEIERLRGLLVHAWYCMDQACQQCEDMRPLIDKLVTRALASDSAVVPGDPG